MVAGHKSALHAKGADQGFTGDIADIGCGDAVTAFPFLYRDQKIAFSRRAVALGTADAAGVLVDLFPILLLRDKIISMEKREKQEAKKQYPSHALYLFKNVLAL